jgi:hypothetical protein
MADLISDNGCAFSILSDNLEVFADTLLQFEKNKANLTTIGENACTLAEREFSRETLAKKWVD